MSFRVDKIGAMLRKRGEVETQTNTHVSIERDADEHGNHRVKITGEAMAVCAAHAMLMKYYNDANHLQEELLRKQRELERVLQQELQQVQAAMVQVV